MHRYLIFAAIFLISILANAQEEQASPSIEWEADLGILVEHNTGLIEGLNRHDGDIQLSAFVSGGLYYDKFFIEAVPLAGRPLTFGYSLTSDEDLQVNFIAESLFVEISQAEQQQGHLLDDITPRRASVEVGVEIMKSNRSIEWQVRLLHDGLNRHHGSVFEAKVAYPIFTRTTLFVPAIGVAYIDENAADFYFGVDNNEVTTNRPFYQASGTWLATARGYFEHPLNSQWSIVGSAYITHFGRGITNSPLVNRNDSYKLSLGVLWSF